MIYGKLLYVTDLYEEQSGAITHLHQLTRTEHAD